eukprot:9790-Heterococcus_DN1.PRE.4
MDLQQAINSKSVKVCGVELHRCPALLLSSPIVATTNRQETGDVNQSMHAIEWPVVAPYAILLLPARRLCCPTLAPPKAYTKAPFQRSYTTAFMHHQQLSAYLHAVE